MEGSSSFLMIVNTDNGRMARRRNEQIPEHPPRPRPPPPPSSLLNQPLPVEEEEHCPWLPVPVTTNGEGRETAGQRSGVSSSSSSSRRYFPYRHRHPPQNRSAHRQHRSLTGMSSSSVSFLTILVTAGMMLSSMLSSSMVPCSSVVDALSFHSHTGGRSSRSRSGRSSSSSSSSSLFLASSSGRGSQRQWNPSLPSTNGVGFVPYGSLLPRTTTATTTTTTLSMAYVRQSEDDPSTTTSASTTTTSTTNNNSSNNNDPNKKTTKPIIPQVGDLVRYYDLDGGNRRGEELVGKITFLTTTTTTATSTPSPGPRRSSSYRVEITQLEDLGDGYYADYSSLKRRSKRTERDLDQISPLRSSFVRSEQAYQVPYDKMKRRVVVRQERYDVDDDWEGPTAVPINVDVVVADGWNYAQLKRRLFRQVAITGLLGTVVVNIIQTSPEDAIIYLAGVMASLAYLFLLTVKTDTLADRTPNGNGKWGNRISNLRFVMPVLLIVGVALYNQIVLDHFNSSGSSSINVNDVANLATFSNNNDNDNPFHRVTPEQFGAAMLGFLTYRLPLFVGQIQDAFKEGKNANSAAAADGGGAVLPGSAGVALQLAKAASASSTTSGKANRMDATTDLIPVLLVSGPQATGRDELVQALLEQDGRVVEPIWVDSLTDGATFDRLSKRRELLHVDPTERLGLTRDGILRAAAAAKIAMDAKLTTDNDNDTGGESSSSLYQQQQQAQQQPKEVVVVVNADVDLAKTLQTSLSGARIIGVWVGLDSVAEFERRLGDLIDQGKITVDEADGETRETVIRSRMKEIIREIDFGLSSGIFEFTILNDQDDPAKSLKELREAVGYCFK